MIIQDIIDKNFGVKTTVLINPLISASAVTTQLLCRANPKRLALSMINLGTFNVYVLPHPSVSATKGYLLPPLGQGMSLNIQDDFILPSLDWYVIGTGVSSLLILETLISS